MVPRSEEGVSYTTYGEHGVQAAASSAEDLHAVSPPNHQQTRFDQPFKQVVKNLRVEFNGVADLYSGHARLPCGGDERDDLVGLG